MRNYQDLGSASELDYHLLLCRDLGFLKIENFLRSKERLTEVRKMLTSFLASVEKQANRTGLAG